METIAPTRTRQHSRFAVQTTCATQFVDLTGEVQRFVSDSGIDDGIVNVQSLHTTAAIVINEHEPLLLADFAALLERTAPAEGPYRHDDMSIRSTNLMPGERVNGHAHCRALLLSNSASLNVAGGQLQLGRWQRVFLVELDGPQRRELSVLLLGETAR
jgi:secondary thiamine-phosphate synthase enzyme